MLLKEVNKKMGKNFYEEIVGIGKKVIDFNEHSDKYPPLIEVQGKPCYTVSKIMVDGISQYLYLGREIHLLVVSAVDSCGKSKIWADIPTGVYV